jgi:hypothetical protein
MTLYSGLLLAFVVALLAWDVIRAGRRLRVIVLLEVALLGGAGLAVLFPHLTSRVAAFLGVGRGVDVFIYPLLIWLVRETLMLRQKEWQQRRQITELSRQMAIRSASRSA